MTDDRVASSSHDHKRHKSRHDAYDESRRNESERPGKSQTSKNEEPSHKIVHPLILSPNCPSKNDVDAITDRFARSLKLMDENVRGKLFAFFNRDDVRKLLHGRLVLLLGDSVTRSMYKDLVHMCSSTSLVYPFDLMRKAEIRFEGDMLVKGAKLDASVDPKGANFQEIRMFLSPERDFSTMIAFAFITRAWNNNLDLILRHQFFNKQNEFGFPDVVFFNSCLWDLARYEKEERGAMASYKRNVELFVDNFDKISGRKTWLVMLSTLPVAKKAAGDLFATDDREFGASNDSILWRLATEANGFVYDIVRRRSESGHLIAYLDICTMTKNLDLIRWRESDGNHWKPQAHRIFSNAMLATVCRLTQTNLPLESPQKYYLACDDLERFRIYLKWMTCQYTKKQNVTFDQAAELWEMAKAAEHQRRSQAQPCQPPPLEDRRSPERRQDRDRRSRLEDRDHRSDDRDRRSDDVREHHGDRKRNRANRNRDRDHRRHPREEVEQRVPAVEEYQSSINPYLINAQYHMATAPPPPPAIEPYTPADFFDYPNLQSHAYQRQRIVMPDLGEYNLPQTNNFVQYEVFPLSRTPLPPAAPLYSPVPPPTPPPPPPPVTRRSQPRSPSPEGVEIDYSAQGSALIMQSQHAVANGWGPAFVNNYIPSNNIGTYSGMGGYAHGAESGVNGANFAEDIYAEWR